MTVPVFGGVVRVTALTSARRCTVLKYSKSSFLSIRIKVYLIKKGNKEASV